MDSSQDFKSLQEKVQSALVAATKTVNTLANQDLQFQRTVNPTVANRLDRQSECLLQLSTGLLKTASTATNQRFPLIDEADDIDIGWKGIVDVIDSLLEKADTCLDEYTGLLKRKDAPSFESVPSSKKTKPTNDRLDWSLKRANIIKPQNAFERKTDNASSGPWKPLLTSKPHAVTPLEESLDTFENEDRYIQHKHPYETEILNLKYPAAVHEKKEAIMYLPIESTSATWVDTYEGVLEMLEELKKASEIAIDLEHHDYRTYSGLLSLMQISTRDKDWIVDTLRPWRHKLEVLNQVFADPSIIKVFHGAYMDIVWLQRDLGLYVVGLFDTHFASDALAYKAKSLAYLLKKFVDFDADKKYQLADWRIRPLPEEMFYYARCDTHYLLYIYDMVRNELIESSDPSNPNGDLVEWVIQKSKEVSLQRFEHPVTDPGAGPAARGWFNFLTKSPQLRTAQQLSVYSALYRWRDEKARREDESPFYIMTQTVLADIAKIIPADQKALWSLLGNQARTLKPHLDELFAVIQEANEKGVGGPTVTDILQAESTTTSSRKPFGRNLTLLSAQRDSAPARKLGEGLPSIEELRSRHSQLFGHVAMSSAHDTTAQTEVPGLPADEIAVPWLELVQNIRTTDAVAPEIPAAESSEPANLGTPEKAAPSFEDAEFILKRGRKRKADDTGAQLQGMRQTDESDLEIVDGKSDESSGGAPLHAAPNLQEVEEEGYHEIDEEDSRERRLARRREKKEKKRAARKAAENKTTGEGESEPASDEDEPFDYSKAQSVLHARRTKESGQKPATKIFDPYKKLGGDAPRAVRHLNYEKAGKTATFKK